MGEELRSKKASRVDGFSAGPSEECAPLGALTLREKVALNMNAL